MSSVPNIVLLLSEDRGTNIPRDFVQGFDLSRWEGIHPHDALYCKDTQHPSYWDSWQNILDNASSRIEGRTYHLYQNGDRFAICYTHLTEEEKKNRGILD